MPTTLRRARRFLNQGRARVDRLFPFTIRLVDRVLEDSVVPGVVVKLDPGSRTTGWAITLLGPPEPPRDTATLPELPDASPDGPDQSDPADRADRPAPAQSGGEVPGPASNRPQSVLFLGELVHRQRQIHEAMTARSQHRRGRRSRDLRYRPPRFLNRSRKEGWLPPSLYHVVQSRVNLVRKFIRLAPVKGIVVEDAKFDTQAMRDENISGVGYQRGELFGYEVKEYLLEKYGHRCVYCGATDRPLEVDHVVPVSKGGTDTISNLVIACVDCNRRKGAQPLEAFLADRPELAEEIMGGLEEPLRDAGVMNGVRAATMERLGRLGPPVYHARASQTKFNRGRFGVPKCHAGDAACAGEMSRLDGWGGDILVITSMGRGRRRREIPDKFGFPRKPRAILPRHKMLFGFITGDFVEGTVTKGANKGVHVGRVTVQSSGQFYITRKAGDAPEDADGADLTASGPTTPKGGARVKKARAARISFSHKNTRLLQRGDGYAYSRKAAPAKTR